MSMPSAWVDALFGRLTVRYGAAFLRQYGDLDVGAVKSDWADVMDGIAADSIRYALEYLPAGQAPNAMQFRDLCRRAPRPDVLRIEAPPEDAEVARRVLDQWRSRQREEDGRSPAEQTIAAIERCRSSGRVLTQAQRDMVQACLRVVEPKRCGTWLAGLPEDPA